MEQSPSEQERGFFIPVWVALAGMVVAVIVAGVIIATVLEPLTNLIFPSEPEPPLPPDVTELERIDNSRTSDGEWLYGVELDGCQVAQFYIDQGSLCVFPPFVCERDADGRLTLVESADTSTTSVAQCEGTSGGVADSYSWEVIISTGYSDYQTKFRLYLYTER